jgi:MFS family permease
VIGNRRARRVALFAAAALIADTVLYGAIVPLVPHYSQTLDLSKAESGVLVGAYAAGTLLGALPFGALAARYAPRAVAIAGLALLALSSAAFGLLDAQIPLTIARFTQGLAGAATWCGAMAWLVQVTPREQWGAAIGVTIGAAIGGQVLGPVLGATASSVGPTPVFGALAALSLVLAALGARLPDQPAVVAHGELSPIRALRRGPLAAAAALLLLPALMEGAFEVLMPLRMNALGATATAIGAVFASVALADAALSPAFGRWSDRRGRLVPIGLGLAAAIPFTLGLALPTAVWLYVVLVVAIWVAMAGLWSPTMALISDAAEEMGVEQGPAWGVVNFAFAIGHLFGSTAISAIAQATSDATAYATVAGLCIVGLVYIGAVVLTKSPLARIAESGRADRARGVATVAG